MRPWHCRCSNKRPAWHELEVLIYPWNFCPPLRRFVQSVEIHVLPDVPPIQKGPTALRNLSCSLIEGLVALLMSQRFFLTSLP